VTRRLEGRTALVTGAGQGLGKVIAARLAVEGARVVLASRSRERLEQTAAEIAAAGGSTVVVPTDLREPTAVEALAQRVTAEVGGSTRSSATAASPGPRPSCGR
jgi:short-subunit dehydrogenase